MITSEVIKSRLWDGATQLRGSMDASRYKDYMLGLMFYKFLSDKTLEQFRTLSGLKDVSEEELLEEYTKSYNESGDDLTDAIRIHLKYYVLPEHLYQVWVKDINEGTFEVQKVTDSLSTFERTASMNDYNIDFRGLFSSNSIDLDDTALGNNLNARSKNIQELIKLFADLNMVELQKEDILGDAYEYLIGQFAIESGKKAGEFYTPKQVSEVMAQIVSKKGDIDSIYDATVGSGSLLLSVAKYLDEDKQHNLKYYGQELNTATYNLTRMNLILHGVSPEKMHIRNANTLEEDWPDDDQKPGQGFLFDAVVMNPPYSLKNWNKFDLKFTDPRFEMVGVLPPDSKGDYAFLLHGLYHLHQEGTMAIVLPHGILFRGGAEGTIRQRLLEKNNVDTIIGLPSGMFTNTGIPVIVMILKKNRKLDDPVLVIDASNDFVKEGKQNVLLDKDIARIVDTYEYRLDIEGYSRNISRQEIVENEFNMNIPRYVQQIDEEIPHDVDGHLYGGISSSNIKGLKILNKYLTNVLEESFKEVRPGYLEMTIEEKEFEDRVKSDVVITNKISSLEKEFNTYIEMYYEKLKSVSNIDDIKTLKEEMLNEMKTILEEYDFVDQYDGYQLISELWTDHLQKDTEIIAAKEFYEVAKLKEPKMATRTRSGKKVNVQEGWSGVLIPNELITEVLFEDELTSLRALENELNETDSELDDLVEASKVEESEEYDALYECLTVNKENEVGNSFVKTSITKEMKDISKDSLEYSHLRNALNLIEKKAKVSKDIRELRLTIEELTNARYEDLTNEEINLLMRTKWFKHINDEISNLIIKPLDEEINVVKDLNERYSTTISDLDREIEELEKSLEDMISQLVYSNE